MDDFKFSPKYPLIDEEKTVDLLNEAYEGVTIYGTPFLELYFESLRKTNCGTNPFQAVNKLRRCYNLVRMFQKVKDVQGDFAEAGVFRGNTSRMLADVAALGGFDMSAREMHLFDSFEGLPDPVSEDLQPHELPEGETSDPYYRETPRRFSNTSLAAVQEALSDVEWMHFHKGWIPDVLNGHEERRFSFVHVDVDLYQSTMDCLNFFTPRMNPGGIMICDDYLSLRFPGARMAWDIYCRERNVKFVTLDNYQSVIFF